MYFKAKALLIILTLNLLLVKAQDATTLLSEYIRIPSVSGNEKKAAQYLEQKCEELGFEIREYSTSDSSYNFSVSIFPPELHKPNIVFLNHIDVVTVDDSLNWKYPPYSGLIINDTIWGRGAIDMKGMAIMQLMALIKLKNEWKNIEPKNIPYNVTMLCVSGEETGGKNGAAIITEKYMNQLNATVVLGEGGAGLRQVIPGKPNQQVFFVSLAEKKGLWFKLEAKLRSHGHASVPSEKSANKVIVHAINKIENSPPSIKFDHTSKLMFRRLGELTGGTQGFVLKHISWLIFKPFRRKILEQNELLLPMVTNTFTLTKIYNPPGAVNQISGSSEVYYDCRLLPRFNEKPLTIRRLTRVLDPRVKLTILDESPEAMPTKPDKYYDILQKAIRQTYPGSEIIPFMFLASSDNSYFRAKNIPTYGLMPLEMNRELMETVHGANERIPVSGLYKGIETYFNFVKNLTELPATEKK